MASLIRVADAPLLGHDEPAAEPAYARSGPVAPPSTFDAARHTFFYALLALLLGCFFGVFGPRHAEAVRALIIARYLLWPLSLIGLAIHMRRHGGAQIVRTLAPLLPFLLIGSFSGLIGYNLILSAKQVIFWLFGITVAVAVGFELPHVSIRRFLLFFFFVLGLMTIAAAILVPTYGTIYDNRLESGVAWVGIFVGKNQMGEAAGYLIVLCFVAATPWWLRIAPLAVGLVCLYMAHSEGSIVTTAIVLGLMTSIVMLRRMGLAPGLQASILITATLLAAAGLMFGLGPLLGALGRDPTLTGRTIIWDLYFHRALYFWVLGAGPGTFMDISQVTSDLPLLLKAFGNIVQPHSMYIATFGETGIVGLFAFVIPLLYMGLVVPFTRANNPVSLPVAAVALTMMIGGLVETHEVFGPAPRMVLVIAMMAALRAADLRTGARDRIADEAAWQPGLAESEQIPQAGEGTRHALR